MRFELVAVLLLLLSASCTFRSRAVKPPKINPVSAADQAISQYDQDGDAELSADEIEYSALTLEMWDGDRNGAIGRDEIVRRLENYLAAKVGMIDVGCFVFYRGVPLKGANLVFEPEEFLSEVVKPAYATTNENGGGSVSVAEEFRPEPNLEGVQIGLYRVRITHPDEDIGQEYNIETTLSYEVSPLEDLETPTYILR